MKKLNDLLWDGDLKIYQDDDKFKFSMDSIFLSNFVSINKNDKNILDIGTGNAPIPLLLSKRCNSNIVGVELQKESFDLAVESVKYNNKKNIKLINMDIKDYANEVESDAFDIIISNPPYFKANNMVSINNSKRIARSEQSLTIEDIVKISRKLLKNGGKLAMVCRTERLIEIILILRNNNIEPKKLQLIYPKQNRESNLMLIEGVKNGKSGLKLLSPIVVHDLDDKFNAEVVKLFTEFGK